MIKPKILEEEPLNMKEVKNELKNIEKRDKELTFRGEKTFNYLNSFKLLSNKDIKEIYDKINKLGIPRLKPKHIHKIIDILPKSVQELKIVMKGYSLNMKKEDMEKIIDIVKKYK